MIILEVDFPCGYHMKFSKHPLDISINDNEIMSNLTERCPLHGKSCKRLGKSKN
jgi:hypothetical protein